MDHVLNVLIKIGPAIFFLALVLAIGYVVFGRIPRDNRGKKQFGRYVLGLGVVGAVAFIAGAALGIAVFCSSEDAGNLCGLGGIFGSGPLLAGVAIAVYAQSQAAAASNGR
jgi:hypothetical protein